MKRIIFSSVCKNGALQLHTHHIAPCVLSFQHRHQSNRSGSSSFGRWADSSVPQRQRDDEYRPMSGMELLEQYNVIQSEGRTTVSGYSDNDYTVNNVRIFGSVFLVPTGAFLWNVQRFEDINKESLKIVEYLNPTPDILIIGTGKEFRRIDDDFLRYYLERGVRIDFMRSIAAISTFNVLNEEGRNVAAAILSLDPVIQTDVTPEKEPGLFDQIEKEAMGKEFDMARKIE